MDKPSEEEVKAAAEAAFQESVKMCEGFTSRQLSVNGLSVGNYRIMRAALIAAAQVRAKTHVWVPIIPTDEMLVQFTDGLPPDESTRLQYAHMIAASRRQP